MSHAPAGRGFFPLAYDELRRLAAARLAGEAAGHSLEATALVHEAYLRPGDAAFADRGGFFRAAAVALQRILVDNARRGKAGKRRGAAASLAVEDVGGRCVADPDTLLGVYEALTRLSADDPSAADVARYRLFAGLSIGEAAGAMGVSRATAFREWAFARSWLATALDSPR